MRRSPWASATVRRRAITVTTAIIPMLVRRMATTDLIGSWAACLSVLALGMAGDARGAGAAGVGEVAGAMDVAGVMGMAGMDAAAGADTDTLALAALLGDAAMLADVVMRPVLAQDADSLAADTMPVVASTAVAAAVSTAVAVDTVVADTGNLRCLEFWIGR